ncbi:MAG TPA: DUF4251 domain-containing protein [Puia sp.]|uniref:DUF4251 domain-containing protein n=1 Tax=Puia sp. TaxID=2045100 RepID=UPI002CA23991|nr:DUF4251 domain-containing protein [Puia sp.]HVU98283.1 DUF4251 domain-containing protein [Puia sp.]
MKSFVLLLSLGFGFIAHAQPKSIKEAVESQHYVFKAQTALPLSGRSRNLTSDYDLRVSPGSVVSYLPYFGRAYQATIGETKSPLDFTSKDFEYTSTPGKKDGWTVTIKPKDYREVQSMTLNISSEGYATLQVISTNRQAISFNGVVSAPRQK